MSIKWSFYHPVFHLVRTGTFGGKKVTLKKTLAFPSMQFLEADYMGVK